MPVIWDGTALGTRRGLGGRLCGDFSGRCDGVASHIVQMVDCGRFRTVGSVLVGFQSERRSEQGLTPLIFNGIPVGLCVFVAAEPIE